MERYYIHLQGTGQRNGVIVIDKKFEVDNNDVNKYTNTSTSKQYIQKALDFYYPGLTSHNVVCANVITEKVKIPQNPDAFEKFIAGAATGYVAAKATNKKKNENNYQPSEYSFVNNIRNLTEISFSTSNESEVKHTLDKIYNEIIDYKWKSTGQDEKVNAVIKENNRVLNMILRNYSRGLKQLVLISTNDEDLKFYKKQYSKLKRKRFFNKYGVIVFAITALVLIITILAVLD